MKNIANSASNWTKRGGYNKKEHGSPIQGKGRKSNSRQINFNGNAKFKFQCIIYKTNEMN